LVNSGATQKTQKRLGKPVRDLVEESMENEIPGFKNEIQETK
jgi:hypothetical protein